MSDHEHTAGCLACAEGIDAYRANMREIISREKVGLAGIVADGNDPTRFVYSIGLSLLGMPEILLIAGFSVPMQVLAGIVNKVAFRWIEEGRATLGVLQNVLDEHDNMAMPVELILVNSEEAKENWTIQVEPILGDGRAHHFDVVQLILPDASGKLPSQPGYDVATYPQPLLTPYNEPPTIQSVH